MPAFRFQAVVPTNWVIGKSVRLATSPANSDAAPATVGKSIIINTPLCFYMGRRWLRRKPLTSPETGPKVNSAQRRAVYESDSRFPSCSLVFFVLPVVFKLMCAGGAEGNMQTLIIGSLLLAGTSNLLLAETNPSNPVDLPEVVVSATRTETQNPNFPLAQPYTTGQTSNVCK